MSAMVDYAERVTSEQVGQNISASFDNAISFINSNIAYCVNSNSASDDNFSEMLGDIEMLINLMDFTSRKFSSENGEFLWNSCSQLAALLEELLKSGERLSKEEALRVEVFYHKLTIMACLFSFGGDEGLRDALVGDSSHEL